MRRLLVVAAMWVLVLALIVVQSCYAIAHPELTDTQRFLDLWYLYAVLLPLFLAAYLLSYDEVRWRQRKK